MSIFDSDIIDELKSLPKGKNHEDSQDVAALAMAGQAVFHPNSPFVSIELRSHVNTMLEMPHDDKQVENAARPVVRVLAPLRSMDELEPNFYWSFKLLYSVVCA